MTTTKCICVDFINHNPDPVPNPDCPLHGAMRKQPQPQKRVVVIRDSKGVTYINPEWLDVLNTQDDGSIYGQRM